jgi:hypothetical protein
MDESIASFTILPAGGVNFTSLGGIGSVSGFFCACANSTRHTAGITISSFLFIIMVEQFFCDGA